jgi:hypothetical protein
MSPESKGFMMLCPLTLGVSAFYDISEVMEIDYGAVNLTGLAMLLGGEGLKYFANGRAQLDAPQIRQAVREALQLPLS